MNHIIHYLHSVLHYVEVSVNKSLLLLMLGLLVLNGCTTMGKNFSEGHHKKIIATIDGEKMPTLGSELYFLCPSFLAVKNYHVLFRCAQLLEDNKEGNWGGFMKGVFYSPDVLHALAYNLKAQAFIELGDFEAAYKYSKLSLNLHSSFLKGTDGTHIKAIVNWGISTARMGKHKEAVLALDELDKSSSGFIGKYAFSISSGRIKILSAMGDYPEIIKNSTKRIHGSAMFVGQNQMFGEVSTALLVAQAKFEVGDIKSSEKEFTKLSSNPIVMESPGLYYQVLAFLGRISLLKGNNDTSINYLKRSISLIESQRSNIDNDANKIGFFGGKQIIYESIVSALLSQNNFDEAFAYAERGKARALVDMLASKKQFNGGDSTNIAEQHQLIAQLDTAEANTRVMSDPKTHSNTRSVAVKARAAIVLQAPELSSLITVEAPDVKEIQSLLPRGETLLEYYGSKDDLFAFVVTADGIRGVKLNGKGLNADISAFREAILNVKSSTYHQSGSKLYQRLIAPLVSGIHTKNLTIVPHGALHYLPFSALTTDHGFMLDRYHIRILPSASVMKFLKAHKNKAGSLLALGNPDLGDAKYDLPFAQKEAIKVSSEVPGAKLLLRSAATETAIKEYGKGFRYLHFASHGTFNAEKPLQSGLLLAKDDKNDGMLTVGELYDLNLNADLVTLSACETALGKVANGDDVVGFTRGFLYAGASTIVSSLWQVDDAATADLMTGFYAKLGKEDKRSALRDAQLATKIKYHHPYYWAAFQMTGAVQ